MCAHDVRTCAMLPRPGAGRVGRRGIDIIVDRSAATSLMPACGHRLVGTPDIVGFAEGDSEIKAGHLLVKNISLIGLQYSAYRDRQPEKVQRVQRELYDWYVAGKIRRM